MTYESMTDGVWDDIWRVFIATLDKGGLLDWQEYFMPGSLGTPLN